MSNIYSSEAIRQMKADNKVIERWILAICFFLGRALAKYFVNRDPRLRTWKQCLIGCLLIAYVYCWGIPVMLYLQFHRVAFPTWMTFGHTVAFGGTTPNVCSDTSREILPDGDWPCFWEDFKIWHANNTGPQGWTHLIRPDGNMVVCICFSIWAILVPVFLAKMLRHTVPAATRVEDSVEAVLDELERKERQLEYGPILYEAGKDQKQ